MTMYGIKNTTQFSWNPAQKIPRNTPCPCNSGKKFKRCCLRTMTQIVNKEDAEKAKPIIKALRNR